VRCGLLVETLRSARRINLGRARQVLCESLGSVEDSWKSSVSLRSCFECLAKHDGAVTSRRTWCDKDRAKTLPPVIPLAAISLVLLDTGLQSAALPNSTATLIRLNYDTWGDSPAHAEAAMMAAAAC